MKLGKNTAKYALGVLQEGPVGALKVAAGLQDSRKKHQRRKAVKSTPTTRNYNIKTNRDNTNVNIWHPETTESGNVND